MPACAPYGWSARRTCQTSFPVGRISLLDTQAGLDHCCACTLAPNRSDRQLPIAEPPCKYAVCCCCASKSQPDRSSQSEWLHTAAHLGQIGAMLQTSMMEIVLKRLIVCCCCVHKQDNEAATWLLPGMTSHTTHKCLSTPHVMHSAPCSCMLRL